MNFHHIKKIFYMFYLVVICEMGNTQDLYANVEISPHVGLNLKDGVTLSIEIDNPLLSVDVNVDDNTWVFGLDTLYRWSDSLPLGLGLRYQSYWIFSEAFGIDLFGIGNYRLNNEGFMTHRLALLGSYRFYSGPGKEFFIGPVVAIDIVKLLQLEVYGLEVGRLEITSFEWLGTGQAGLEVGFKIAPYAFLKIEFGYSLFAFKNLECNDLDCSVEVSNALPLPLDVFNIDIDTKLDLTAFYTILGFDIVF